MSTLLALVDVADRAKVAPPVVSNWRNRHPDFPAPVAVVARGRTPLWREEDVDGWLANRAAQAAKKRTARVERLRAELQRLEVTA